MFVCGQINSYISISLFCRLVQFFNFAPNCCCVCWRPTQINDAPKQSMVLCIYLPHGFVAIATPMYSYVYIRTLYHHNMTHQTVCRSYRCICAKRYERCDVFTCCLCSWTHTSSARMSWRQWRSQTRRSSTRPIPNKTLIPLLSILSPKTVSSSRNTKNIFIIQRRWRFRIEKWI